MSSSRSSERPEGTKPLVNVGDVGNSLRKILNDFVHGHHELMQTAEHVADQVSEMDSPERQYTQGVRRIFPDLNEEMIERSVAQVAPIWAMLDDEPATSDEERRLRNDAFNAKLREIHPKLEDVVPPGHAFGCLDAAVSTRRSRNRSSRLMASLLISLVAEFEVLVSNLLGVVFRLRPGQAISKDRSFGWELICGHDDLASLKDRIVEDTVMDVMYKSYSTWLDKFHSFGVAVPTIARDSLTHEVFQRRHIVVHNGGRVSSAYLKKCTQEPKPALHEALAVDYTYLRSAADRLLATGMILIVSVIHRMIPDAKDRAFLDHLVARRIYDLLAHRRFEALVTILQEVDTNNLGDDAEAIRCSVNQWLALKRLGRFEECKEEIAAWKPSESEPLFQLARLALLDEIDAGLVLIDELRESGELPLESWASWPLLEELRRAETQRTVENAL